MAADPTPVFPGTFEPQLQGSRGSATRLSSRIRRRRTAVSARQAARCSRAARTESLIFRDRSHVCCASRSRSRKSTTCQASIPCIFAQREADANPPFREGERAGREPRGGVGLAGRPRGVAAYARCRGPRVKPGRRPVARFASPAARQWGRLQVDEGGAFWIKRARNARVYAQVVRRQRRDDQLRRALNGSESSCAALLASTLAGRTKPALRLIRGGLADEMPPAA
jgi:hypothetical protein